MTQHGAKREAKDSRTPETPGLGGIAALPQLTCELSNPVPTHSRLVSGNTAAQSPLSSKQIKYTPRLKQPQKSHRTVSGLQPNVTAQAPSHSLPADHTSAVELAHPAQDSPALNRQKAQNNRTCPSPNAKSTAFISSSPTTGSVKKGGASTETPLSSSS